MGQAQDRRWVPPTSGGLSICPALPSGSGSTTNTVRVIGYPFAQGRNHPQHIFWAAHRHWDFRRHYRAVSARPSKIAATPWPPAAQIETSFAQRSGLFRRRRAAWRSGCQNPPTGRREGAPGGQRRPVDVEFDRSTPSSSVQPSRRLHSSDSRQMREHHGGKRLRL